MDDSLDDLLRRARAGDKDAEEMLFRYLFERFVIFAKRRVSDRDEAQDIAQKACITVFQKYKTETFRRSFAAWAYGVLRNKIGNYLQKNDKDPLVVRMDLGGDCPGAPASQETRRKLIHCFRLLLRRNRQYARVLNLVHQGYKTTEICERLKITSNNLYVTLSRARHLLRKCMEKGVM
jgi:RNA polymerase sigma factor (sigma-70 family)